MAELVTSARDIAGIRPMALLKPPALLSDSFTESILSRAGYGDGAYPFVALIFADEDGGAAPSGAPEYRINVNLSQNFNAIQGAIERIFSRSHTSVLEWSRGGGGASELLRRVARSALITRLLASPARGLPSSLSESVARRAGGWVRLTELFTRSFERKTYLTELFTRSFGRKTFLTELISRAAARGAAFSTLLARDYRAAGRGHVALSGGDIGAVYGLLRLSGERRRAPGGAQRLSAAELAELLISGADASSPRAREQRERAEAALRAIADGELLYSRESSAAREYIRESIERIELAETEGARGRSGAREQIERVAHRLEAAERAADRERAVSGERIRQVVERIEGAESAEASERVVSRERLRQVIERLEAAERAEGAESVVSRERLRQVLERIEAVEAREAGEDAVSRERIRQVIERLEHADDERRRESIVTRERIRQVIERLEAAAQGESRESSLTKTRIEEVIEQIGGADAEKTRRDYRDRQARAPKTWYAPFTLALSKAFSRELLRDRTGLVRGESDKLEEVVTPVMRERYRALTKSFSDELLSRARGTPSNRGSVFNLLFKEERLGDTSAETNNIFNIFSRRLSERNVTGEGARDAATRAYMESVSGNALRYASPVRLGEAPTPAASPSAGDMTADELGALPAWARDFIREGVERRGSAASGDAGAVRRGMTALTDITSSSVGGQAMSGSVDGDTVVWSAPKITSAPAPTALRRDGGAEERRTAPERLSDTEIQRMADKVYGIIESRVSLERRRLGY